MKHVGNPSVLILLVASFGGKLIFRWESGSANRKYYRGFSNSPAPLNSLIFAWAKYLAPCLLGCEIGFVVELGWK